LTLPPEGCTEPTCATLSHAAQQTLDAVPHPSWVLRADAHIDFANASAHTLSEELVWVGTTNGQLRRIGHLDITAFKSSLAPDGHSIAPLLSASCVVDGRLRRATVHIASTHAQPAYAAAWPHASVLLMLDMPAPEQRTQTWIDTFARCHQLTTAEAQVLTLLTRSQDVPAIAEQLGIAYSTARTHMGTLLRKTGCTRQAELVRNVFDA
jgi:DNA-binding CsgD family transcriptional regulator